MRWAERCKNVLKILRPQILSFTQNFGIVQGGMHANLGFESLQRLCEIGFDGYAIGGLSVGESKNK